MEWSVQCVVGCLLLEEEEAMAAVPMLSLVQNGLQPNFPNFQIFQLFNEFQVGLFPMLSVIFDFLFYCCFLRC